MAKVLYTATVELAFSLPWGDMRSGRVKHLYASGKGVAMSRSPKKAIERATTLAERQCGGGTSWVPILSSVSLKLGTREVYSRPW